MIIQLDIIKKRNQSKGKHNHTHNRMKILKKYLKEKTFENKTTQNRMGQGK
jgi:hypothetical protein